MNLSQKANILNIPSENFTFGILAAILAYSLPSTGLPAMDYPNPVDFQTFSTFYNKSAWYFVDNIFSNKLTSFS